MKFSALSPEYKQFREKFERSSPDLLPGRREHLHPLTVLGEAMDSDELQSLGIPVPVGRMLRFEGPEQPVPPRFPSLPRRMLSIGSVDIPNCTKYGYVLVLAVCTEQELVDTSCPLFAKKQSDGFVDVDLRENAKVVGNNFRHGIEIADSEQPRIDLVLVIVTMDGQVFEQVAFAAFVAYNLRAHFDVMPVISKQESNLLLTAIANSSAEQVVDSEDDNDILSYQPKVTEDGRTVLVDRHGNEVGAPLDLPDGIENIIGTEDRPQRIVMEANVPLPGIDDPTDVLDESQDGMQAEAIDTTVIGTGTEHVGE